MRRKSRWCCVAVCLLCFALGSSAWGKYIDEAAVMQVQEKLNSLGYDCGEADGVAGLQTMSAIVDYQRANDLTANGMVTDELLVSLGLEDESDASDTAVAGDIADAGDTAIADDTMQAIDEEADAAADAADSQEGAGDVMSLLADAGAMLGNMSSQPADEGEALEAITEGSEPETEAGPAIWEGTYNLLVIGTDRRSGTGWNGNSDVNILITLNHNVGKIFMVSFMRDLYADIPGYGGHKLNYAYAAEGPSKLIETLYTNFGVHVDNYVCVDWEATARIIDMFGGVDIEIHDYEISEVNSYAEDTGRDLGMDVGGYIYSSGYQHLTGVQAVGYSRVRFVGDNDYERTERQRNVLSCLADKVRNSSKADILKNMTMVMALVDNNLTPADAIRLATEYLTVKDYELVRDRVPYDGMFYNQSEMLVPDQPYTNDRLLGEIYAQ